MEFVNDENDDERPEIDPDKFVEERKRKMRRSAWWSIVGGPAVTIFTVGGALYILNSPELVEKFELRDDSLFSVAVAEHPFSARPLLSRRWDLGTLRGKTADVR